MFFKKCKISLKYEPTLSSWSISPHITPLLPHYHPTQPIPLSHPSPPEFSDISPVPYSSFTFTWGRIPHSGPARRVHTTLAPTSSRVSFFQRILTFTFLFTRARALLFIPSVLARASLLFATHATFCRMVFEMFRRAPLRTFTFTFCWIPYLKPIAHSCVVFTPTYARRLVVERKVRETWTVLDVVLVPWDIRNL